MVWWPGADSHRPQWEAQRVRGNHQSDLWPRWGGPVARVRNIRDSEVAGVCTELRAHITMGGRCCSAQGTTLHSMWGIHSMGVGGLWLVAGCQRCLVSLLRCSPKPVSFWPQGGEKWKDGANTLEIQEQAGRGVKCNKCINNTIRGSPKFAFM